MYFEGENYIHPKYGSIPKRCVLESIEQYIKDYEYKSEEKMNALTKNQKAFAYTFFALTRRDEQTTINNLKKITNVAKAIDKSFFSFVREDVKTRVSNLKKTKTEDFGDEHNINPNLALLLLYTEFIPYQEIVYALYKEETVIHLFYYLIQTINKKTYDYIAIFMLGFDEYIKRPEIIATVIGFADKLFYNENIIELFRVVRNTPVNTKENETSDISEYPGLCSIDRLTPKGLKSYEFFYPVFSSINIDDMRNNIQYMCSENPDKIRKIQPMRLNFYISAYGGTKWIRDDMLCVKKNSGSCCSDCSGYIKLEKLYSVYLSTKSLYEFISDKLFEEKIERKCLEEELLEKQFIEELEQLDSLDSLESQILNMTNEE